MQRPVSIDAISPLRDPSASLGDLGLDDAARALAAASDILLVIDADGVIADLAHSGVELSREGCAAWIGRPWIETVAADSRLKVEEMLAAPSGEVLPAVRQVNHLSPRGTELPVSYAVIPFGAGGRRLAIGRRCAASPRCRTVSSRPSTPRSANTPACATPRRAIGCCSRWPPTRC